MSRINFKALSVGLFTIYCMAASAENKAYTDSLNVRQSQPVTWSLNSQIHSASLYFFTGSVDQQDQSFDMLFIYDRKSWGGIIYKSFDVLNSATGVNYAILALHKHFKIDDNLQVTPNVGVNLNQNRSFADAGSDLMVDMALDYNIGKYFMLSGDAIFQNIGITSDHNWTNRLKLSFSDNRFDTAVLLWDRNRVFNNSGYLSSGISAGYSGFKLTPTANLGLSAQSIIMLQSDTKKRNGFMFSMALII
jgi:hypothetical protein